MRLLAFIIENKNKYDVIINITLDRVLKAIDGGTIYYGNHVILLVKKPQEISLRNIKREVCFEHFVIVR